MTQNKKKGIAKKALSISLVAAMLATSNVPVWASGFEAVDEQAGFTLESEAPVEAVTADDTALLTSVEADFTGLDTLKGKLGEFIWYESATKMAEALDAAKKVKAAADAVPVYSAEVGLVDAAAAITDGALEVGREFTAWTAGQKYTGNEVGKKIVAKLVLKDGEAPYYVAATADNTVLAANATDAAQVKDWSVVINGKTFTKGSTDVSVPAADKYELGQVVLTLGDNSTVTIPDASLLVNGEITLANVTSGLGTAASTIEFDNYLGINGVLSLKTFEIVGKELSSVISVADGTLAYDPSDANGTGALLDQAKKLVNEGKLNNTDYSVSLATKADGTGSLTVAPAAGDTVYIVVAGAGEYASYKSIIKAVKIAAKDLNTLYLDQEKIDAIAYTDTDFDTALATALKSVFKYNGADDAVYFDPAAVAYKNQLVLSYTKNTTAGQPITVTVSPVQGNGNFTGSKTFTFTAKTSALPTGTDTALNAVVTGAKFTYDGKNHSINNLAKGNIGVFTRAEYTLTCVEEPSGSVKNAGDYTIVMNITSGAYAGQKLTATTKLTVEKASLNNFKYGKDVSITPVQWVKDLTTTTDLKAKAAPVLTFNGTTLVEGVDYKLDKVVVAGTTIGSNITMDIDVPSDNVKCNFKDKVTGAVVGKLQARQLPELAEVPAQTYNDVKAAYINNDIAKLKAKKNDGTDGTYADLILDTDINENIITIDPANYSAKFSALPESGEGQVTLTIIGKGTYTGTITKTIAVTKKEVNASFIYNNSDILPRETYTNTAATSKNGIVLQSLWKTSDQTITDKVIVRDEDGTNVTANCDITYTNNKAVGTATIEATGKAGYNIHAISTFEILPQQKVSSDVTFSPDPVGADFYYTGDEINPITEKKVKITIKDADTKYTLKEGIDYKVSFLNNINAATAGSAKAPSIVITGMGNYTFVQVATLNAKDNTGAVKEFTITATPITAANVTVNNVVYAGGLEVTPDIKVVNPNSGKELVKDKDYQITLENAVNAGTAKATIKPVEGNANYTITPFTVTFNIAKKNLSACTGSVVNGKVVVKDGVLTVPESEYTATKNEDGTFTVKAAEKNYTGTITVKELAPEATTLKVTNRTTSTVSLGWNKVEGAEGYTIWFRSEHDSSVSRKIITGGDVTKWTQKGLAAGTKYFYTIKAWVKDAEGNYVFSEQSEVQRGTTKPYAAKIKSVTAANGKVKVALTGRAAGAEKYSMCYSKGGSKFNEKKFSVGIRTSYTTRTFSKTLTAGTYYVCVKSYRDLGNGKRVYGAWSNSMKVVVK